MCQLTEFPTTLSRKPGALRQCYTLPSLVYAECILDKSPVHQQPNFGYILERFKEVSNHSSHVILKRGAIEPGLNHTFFFFCINFTAQHEGKG